MTGADPAQPPRPDGPSRASEVQRAAKAKQSTEAKPPIGETTPVRRADDVSRTTLVAAMERVHEDAADFANRASLEAAKLAARTGEELYPPTKWTDEEDVESKRTTEEDKE